MKTVPSIPAHATSSTEEKREQEDSSDLGDENSDCSGDEIQPRRSEGDDEFTVEDEIPQAAGDHLIDWFDPETETTVLAIHHDNYRSRFIARQNALGEYEHKPFAGDLPHDVTCFHADYEHSGPDRADWPRILYQYKKDNIFPSVVRPKKLLTPEGYVVLNKDDEPILDFPGLPLTISSRCEGWRLEAFCRSNKWVTSKQIRSRMPGNVSIKLNKLSMRRTRFRRKAGAIAWDTAGGASEAFEAYIDAKLPQVCKAANSIESFRDLYPHEIAEMELQNLGRYPGRARGRTDTSAENFQRKRDTALAEYNRLKAEFDSRNSQERGEGNTASDGGSSEGATTANGKDRDSLYPSEGGEDLIGNRNEPILDPAPDNGSGEQGHQDQAESRENSGLGPTNGSASVAEQIGSIDCSDDENESEKDGGSREEDRSGTEGSVSLLSVEASDSEADNILYQDPATDAESQLVQRLLQPTKDHFEWLVGSAPPSTDPTRSYIYQWGDIATAWQQHWESYGPEGQPDLLIGLTVFRADTVEWNMCSEEIPPSGLELGDLSGLDELFSENEPYEARPNKLYRSSSAVRQ